MRIDRIGCRGLILVAAAFGVTGITPASDMRPKVERASVVVIASLASANELTANGMDYGRGILRVDRTVFPPEFNADRLLLRWNHRTRPSTARPDPRVLLGKAALWLLELQPDGTVHMTGNDSAVPFCDVVKVDAFATRLEGLYGNGYDEKVRAIEAALAGVPDVRAEDRVTNEALPPVVHEIMAFALRDYGTYPDFKAFAIAVDSRGKWVFGYSAEMPTEEFAKDHALRECSVRAAKMRVNAGCYLYAVGDTVVW